MLALTIHRPWPFAIFGLPPQRRKRIENRSWKPPKSVIGQRIAIHAGKVFDYDADEILRDDPLLAPFYDGIGAAMPGIVGTVLVKGWIKMAGESAPSGMFGSGSGALTRSPEIMSFEAETLSRSLFFFGPYGWVLDDPKPCTPILIGGHQGLWLVPTYVERELAA